MLRQTRSHDRGGIVFLPVVAAVVVIVIIVTAMWHASICRRGHRRLLAILLFSLVSVAFDLPSLTLWSFWSSSGEAEAQTADSWYGANGSRCGARTAMQCSLLDPKKDAVRHLGDTRFRITKPGICFGGAIVVCQCRFQFRF